jgi:hypothetical protein
MGISLNKKHGSQGVAEEVNQRFRTGDSYTCSFKDPEGLVYGKDDLGSLKVLSLSDSEEDRNFNLPFGVDRLFDHASVYGGPVNSLIGSQGTIDMSQLNSFDRVLLVFDFEVECSEESLISSSFLMDVGGSEVIVPGTASFIPSKSSGRRIHLQSTSILLLRDEETLNSYSLPAFSSDGEAVVFPKQVSLIILR